MTSLDRSVRERDRTALEAALLELGLAIETLAPMQRHERVRHIRSVPGMDLPKAVAAEAVLFPNPK